MSAASVRNLQANAASSHVYASTSIQLRTLALQCELSFRAASESELVESPSQFQVTALSLQGGLGKHSFPSLQKVIR